MTRDAGRAWIVAFALLLIGCKAQPSPPGPVTDPPHVAPIETIAAGPSVRRADVDIVGDDESASGCTVDSTGALWCWGPDPTLRVHLRPRPNQQSAATRVRGADGARRVAMSSDDVCTIDGGGRVRCIGPSTTWQEIRGVENAVDIRIFGERACALQADGALWCWDGAQLPLSSGKDVLAFDLDHRGACPLWAGGEISCPLSHTQWDAVAVHPGAIDFAIADSVWLLDDHGRVFEGPTQIGVVPSAVEIEASHFHVCVRTRNGAVYCRGKNQYGQLGDGSSSPRDEFVIMVPSGAEALALTNLRTCVAKLDDKVVCAGLDVDALDPPQGTVHQHTIEGLVAVSLAAQGPTTCAIDSAGALRCWGWELLGSWDGVSEATFGIELAVQPSLVSESVGSLHGIVSYAETLHWVGGDGRRHFANWIGAPDWSLVAARTSTPESIRSLTREYLTCTLEAGKRADVLACGVDHWERAPVPIEGPVDFAMQHVHVCAIDHRARIVCVIHPDRFEEGLVPVVPKIIPGVRKPRKLAMSWSHACALVAGGRVQCWTGWTDETYVNDEMQREYAITPAVDLGLSDVHDIVATDRGFCSVDGRGALRCWSPDDAGLMNLPGPVIDEPVVEIVAGDEHACARDHLGAVTCWGDEWHGQLGRIPPAVSLRPTPLRFEDVAPTK